MSATCIYARPFSPFLQPDVLSKAMTESGVPGALPTTSARPEAAGATLKPPEILLSDDEDMEAEALAKRYQEQARKEAEAERKKKAEEDKKRKADEKMQRDIEKFAKMDREKKEKERQEFERKEKTGKEGEGKEESGRGGGEVPGQGSCGQEGGS